MKKIIFLLSLILLSNSSYAGFVPEIQRQTVHVPFKYAKTNSFNCNNKIYYSDVKMPKYHGCDSEPIGYGYAGVNATLVTTYYDWEKAKSSKAKTPKSLTFIILPDGEIYRIADTTFISSPRLQYYFDRALGIMGKGPTNITMERFTQRNIKSYANTFCVEYHLKHPFSGIYGWCQNDRLVGGEIGYLKGSLTYTRAALLVQNYIYDQNLKVEGGKLLNPSTISALNTDKNGWLYYAFATKATIADGREGAYSFRVYFNGKIEPREHHIMPTNPDKI